MPTEYNQFINALIFYLEANSEDKERILSLLELKHKQLLKAYSQLSGSDNTGAQLVDLTQQALDEVRNEQKKLIK